MKTTLNPNQIKPQQPRVNRLFTGIFGLFMVMGLSGCVGAGGIIDRTYRGIVLDLDTGKPVADAYVVGIYYGGKPRPAFKPSDLIGMAGAHGGGGSQCWMTKGVLSDEKGEFVLEEKARGPKLYVYGAVIKMGYASPDPFAQRDWMAVQNYPGGLWAPQESQSLGIGAAAKDYNIIHLLEKVDPTDAKWQNVQGNVKCDAAMSPADVTGSIEFYKRTLAILRTAKGSQREIDETQALLDLHLIVDGPDGPQRRLLEENRKRFNRTP